MLVTCPQCKSIFKLPDTDENIKMRCSICQTVFALEDSYVVPEPTTSSEPIKTVLNGQAPRSETLSSQISTLTGHKTERKQNKILRIISVLVFLSIFSIGMLWQFTNILDPILGLVMNTQQETPQEAPKEVENKKDTQLAEMVRLLEMTNVRQYTVLNEKIGDLTVIEGNIKNGFNEKRELIRLSATLFDADGNSLVTKSRLGGGKASLFQLQVLSEIELEQILNNNLDILSANTNVAPGGNVPFMFIFYSPPETAANFGIKIIDAKKPGVRKKPSKAVAW